MTSAEGQVLVADRITIYPGGWDLPAISYAKLCTTFRTLTEPNKQTSAEWWKEAKNHVEV